ncbi:hypothetical protein ACFQ12_08525, partial [Methylobacterium trifolii]
MRALDAPPPVPHPPSRYGPDGTRRIAAERLLRDDGPALEILVARPETLGAGAPVLFVHGALAGAWCWRESYLPAFAGAGRHAAAV